MGQTAEWRTLTEREMAQRIKELEALINELREAPLGPDVLRILAPWLLKVEALLP